jgi:hypothetical protein
MKKWNIIFVLASVLFCNVVFAQKTFAKPIKFKPPKLFSLLGAFKDSMNISPAQVDAVIGVPLKVVNAKNEEYQVTSYNFLYKKIVTSEKEIEGEINGKPYLTTSIKSALFNITPLPKLWTDAVRELPRPDEVLIFFDIIVKDKNGIYIYAPNIKLTIK